jgi:hypothetical protein
MNLNLDRLYQIINECSTQVRIGDVVKQETVGPLSVTTVDAMPAESDLVDGLKVIDLVLLKVGVEPDCAAKHKEELVKLIEPLRTILEPGPSYITIGGYIGDQGTAFQLMAIGEVLGLWTVITPRLFGINEEPQLTQAAGQGLIMISGYRRAGEDDITQTEREAGD